MPVHESASVSDGATADAGRKRLFEWLALGTAAIVLGVSLVYFQEHLHDLEYLRTRYWGKLRDVALNRAPNPWQYRIASDLTVYYVTLGLRRLTPGADVAFVLLGLRTLQAVAVLLVMARYLRDLGLGVLGAAIGCAVFTLCAYQAAYSSDLSFNTHSEVLLYLLFCICLLRGRMLMAALVGLVGALNRETAGMMAVLPAIPLAQRALLRGSWPKRREISDDRGVRLGVAVLILWVCTFVGLRIAYGMKPWSVWNLPPMGWPLLRYNLGSLYNIMVLVQTLGLFVVTGILSACRARTFPSLASVAFVAVWFPIHFLTALTKETRLFLVPLAVGFIPATLLWWQSGSRPESGRRPTGEGVPLGRP